MLETIFLVNNVHYVSPKRRDTIFEHVVGYVYDDEIIRNCMTPSGKQRIN